ncbi:MAG: type II secretion system protein, partial [Anaerotignum sp.]|nr:type II secretion system protein [Anaerotignum sp.]
MMHKLLLKNKKGYTLTEMMVAVAILLIVCVIAIPSVGSLRKNLALTKYDDVARQIFLVSQNKLTTMKACGTLDAFLKKVEKEYSERQLGALNREPQDYDGDSDDWKKLYYFTDTDEVFIDYIIGADSVLLASMENNGHFLEELNPETGDVYGVFYSEKPFTYDEIEELHSRTKSERKEKMIGYYGGISELSAVANLPQEFTPSVSVVNKEDLYLSIECAEMRKLIKTQDKIVLTVTLTDESFVLENASDHIATINLKGGTDFWISNDKVEIQVLLDSIRGGNEGFENITQGKLTPGDNISATVSMTYANEEVTITGGATAPATNSLFASKDDDNLAVAYVRHLNNLRSEAYSFTGREGVTISQTAAIDYDYNHWDDGVMIDEHAGEAPYAGTFAPIENAGLFNHITLNGNNNKLLNFDISGANYVGLFSSLQNCTLTDMKLVNFNVSGNAYTGALAGQMVGGSITNCGVYLETRDEYNRPVMDMADRVQRYTITGTDYVGGLVGRITGTGTSGSFAAINVSGNSYVGGFCGQYNNGSVLNSYASGKVNATLYYAGGFAGETSNSSLIECYATADVTYIPYYAYAGGFVGRAANGSITNCNSYGLVQRSDGSIDKDTSGGFAGSSTASFDNCKYLSQANYNSKYSSATGVSPKGFPELKVSGNLADNCYPYNEELIGNAMPFQMLTTGEGGIIPHYGDWPAQLKLQTSLVYYEKYATADAAGNYYGYYAETSLTAEGEGLETGEVNSWKVDTLRQEACIEDGYALMSVFALSKFTYRLNDDINSAAPTVTVLADTTPGTNKAVKITNKVSLEFYNTADSSRYTISNAMVYQFPFSLQMTDRNTAARFYDRLTITGYIDERVMFENYTFFYCPDFAKNAINPDISETAAATPKNPTGETKPIYVRSPRQINELGRAGYYWNTTLWTDSQDTQYYFKQENDIDFAKYTKTYCGVSYNLMNTSETNKYRNKPIGRPNTYNAKNFRNIYDGQGYRIIDYCCVTTQADGYQFTGLFGEVQGAKLKNIVMVASDPGNESGKVISRYNGSSNHAGVGALAGLVYVGELGYDDNEQYRDDDAYSYASVTNCSVSGYTVSYAPTGKANQPCAVGGLTGYNFGKIENCSAVSKLVTANANSNNKTRFIGGLVGSINGRGSITNCYAGGVVNGDKYTSITYLAGICAGIDYIYGAYNTQPGMRSMPVKNVYSYCTWENGEIHGVPYA